MLNSQIQSSRQNVKRHDEYPGVLGDGNGNYFARRSRYWVRFPLGTNSDGQITYSPARAVRYAGESPLIAKEGNEVLVRVDPYDGVETITRMTPDFPDRADFDSTILNSASPVSAWTDARNFIRLLTRPTGGVVESTKVTTRENPFHVDDFLDWSTYTGTLPDDQTDVSASIPTADNHRLALFFFDWLANAPAVKYSTTQALSSDLDSTDYDEAFAQLPHNEFTPLLALKLADAQAGVTMQDVIEDLRTWIPPPRVYGFPNPIPSGKSIIIRSTHQEILYNLTVVGNLTIEGNVTVL